MTGVERKSAPPPRLLQPWRPATESSMKAVRATFIGFSTFPSRSTEAAIIFEWLPSLPCNDVRVPRWPDPPVEGGPHGACKRGARRCGPRTLACSRRDDEEEPGTWSGGRRRWR